MGTANTNQVLSILGKGLKELATMGGRLSDETAAELDNALDSDEFADTGEEVHRSRYDDIDRRVKKLEEDNPSNLNDRMTQLEQRFDQSDEIYDNDQKEIGRRLSALEDKSEPTKPETTKATGSKKS